MTFRKLVVTGLSAGLLLCPLALHTEQPPKPKAPATMRLNGTIRAVRTTMVQVPQMQGQGGNLTLIKLSPNGATVQKGDALAQFDDRRN